MKVNLLLVRHKKGIIPRLIRWVTRSHWDHVAVHIPYISRVYENDLSTNVNAFGSYWLDSPEGRAAWEVMSIPTDLTTSMQKLEQLKNEKYSIWHNVKTFLWHKGWFRKHIAPTVGKSNCVGYFIKIVSGDDDLQFLYPHQVKEATHGSTTQG